MAESLFFIKSLGSLYVSISGRFFSFLLKLDYIEYVIKVLNCKTCASAKLLDTANVYVHVVEAMDKVFHQDDLAQTVKFEQAHSHHKRVVS